MTRKAHILAEHDTGTTLMATTACGAVLTRHHGGLVTDRGEATCRLCLRATEPPRPEDRPRHAIRRADPFVDATRDGLPQRDLTAAAAALWAHSLHEFLRAVLDGPGPKQVEPFRNVRHALLEYLGHLAQGAPERPSIANPDAMSSRAAFGYGGSSTTPGPDRGQRHIERLVPVRRAWLLAYERPEDARLDVEGCHYVLARRVALRHPTGAIAADLRGLYGVSISPKIVGRIARAGSDRMAEYLRGCDPPQIPPLREPTTPPAQYVYRDEEASDVARVTECDLKGWGEITAHLGGVSVDAARRWAKRCEDPMPVVKDVAGVVRALRSELDAWQDRQGRQLGAA